MLFSKVLYFCEYDFIKMRSNNSNHTCARLFIKISEYLLLLTKQSFFYTKSKISKGEGIKRLLNGLQNIQKVNSK